MVWVANKRLGLLQRLSIAVARMGPVPRHVAFIMDGNRRYASRRGVGRGEGHSRGFDKLSETMQWCLELGITEVTVYAFSIENFKRSREEVATLMDLAREKFRKVLEEKETLMEKGVKIRVVGSLKLLPEDLQQLIAQATDLTKDNSKAFLNVAFSYTSRDEITASIRTIVEGVKCGLLSSSEIDEDLVHSCLYLPEGPDLLVRTSGEVRLSDFLLLQTASTPLFFADILWPDFSLGHLLSAVFYYQRHLPAVEGAKRRPRHDVSHHRAAFLDFVQQARAAPCYDSAFH